MELRGGVRGLCHGKSVYNGFLKASGRTGTRIHLPRSARARSIPHRFRREGALDVGPALVYFGDGPCPKKLLTLEALVHTKVQGA